MDFSDLIPLLLIIGIPLLRSRMKGQNSQQRNKRNPKPATSPHFEYDKNTGKDYEIDIFSEKSSSIEKINEKQSNTFEEKDDKYDKIDDVIEDVIDVNKNTTKLSIESEDEIYENKTVFDNMLKERNVLQGIVFSEILGPPKSKRKK